MRVLQVMSGAEVGGAETFFVDLAGSLHRAGLEQCAVIRRNSARAATLRAAGIATVELPFHRWFDSGSRAQLKRIIARFRPDIVQTWMSRASAACPCGPFVHVGWFGGYYDLKYFRRCRELIGVTQDLVAHIRRGGWPAEHSFYLPTLAFSTPMPALPRAAFDTPENAPLILALGRLHRVKGFDVLLNAMASIPGAYLWLAGEGPLRGELEAQVHALGLEARVRFLGWRNDRAALFASCDMCVMPSRDEPFGTVMIEAWACRKPMVAAAAQGPRALIRNGENGLIVPVDDVAALAGAIRTVIAQPALAQTIVENAWAEYQGNFTEARVVERYMEFYRSLLRK